MTDVHSARVEAATNAMVDSEAYYCALHMRPDELRKDARDVLAAADAVVTVDQIERAIMGRTATAGAKAVHRLYRGEQDDD